MADSAAIYFRQKDNKLYPLASAFREDVDPFIEADSYAEARATKSLECSQLQNMANEITEYVIGSPPFDENFFALTDSDYFRKHVGHRLLVIPLSEYQTLGNEQAVFGCITLVMASDVDRRHLSTAEEIGGAYEFLRSYLAVALQLVYASYVWERFTRSYLSHELHRLEIEFEARLMRARRLMHRIEDANLRSSLTQALNNLNPTLADLAHFNSIFRSVSFVEPSDPLIAAAKKLYDAELEKPEPPISIRDIFNEVFKSRQTQADERHIRIVNLMPSVTPKLRMARRNLTEALGNLAENAVKYARDRSVIELNLRVNEDDAYVTISNIGPWISDEERRRAFEEGFRGQSAIRMRIRGMGRGLGYARDIMRLYGGEIRYKTRPLSGPHSPIAEGDPIWHDVELKFPSTVVVGGNK